MSGQTEPTPQALATLQVRAAVQRRQREAAAGRGVVGTAVRAVVETARQVGQALGLLDTIDQEAARRVEAQHATARRGSAEFDRMAGPDERDLLPGSPRAHLFRGRRVPRPGLRSDRDMQQRGFYILPEDR